MNPQQPHHLVYSGSQYYPQQHSGPGDSPSVRHDNFSYHNPPYSNPSIRGPHPNAFPEQQDPPRVQPRTSTFYPNYGPLPESRPYDLPNAHHTPPLGVDTDFRNGRYSNRGPPAAASKPSTTSWHDGPRYSTEASAGEASEGDRSHSPCAPLAQADLDHNFAHTLPLHCKHKPKFEKSCALSDPNQIKEYPAGQGVAAAFSASVIRTFRCSTPSTEHCTSAQMAYGQDDKNPSLFGDLRGSVQSGPFEHPLPPPAPPARQMPPPSSPQHFTPRSQHAGPPSLPPPTPTSATNRDLPSLTSFHTRPGSSMSISSMLGADPERPREPPPSSASYSLPTINQGSQNTNAYPGASMSPPRVMSRHQSGEYPQMTRARTPEKFGYSAPSAPRQHRSSSGGVSSFGRISIDEQYSLSTPRLPGQNYGDHARSPFASESTRRPPDDFEHSRRSSLGGPLPRPNSQPQPQNFPSVTSAFSMPPSRETIGPEYRTHISDASSARRDQILPPRRQDSLLQEAYPRDASRQSPATPLEYRPTYSGIAAHLPLTEKTDERKALSPWETSTSSPTLRRIGQAEAIPPMPFESPGRVVTAPPEPLRRLSPPLYTSQPPPQPDQNALVENKPLGERQEMSQHRHYSPFSAPASQQQLPTHSTDESNRRPTEDLPQHRSLLNVANENKRGGRASPVPQAVQGAQAQIVGPETAIKSEHGRVFSGIGGGVGSVTTGPPSISTPTAQTVSPFRREETASRAVNDDHPLKPSRSTSGVGKRGRRVREEDGRGGGEPVDGRNTPMLSRGAKKVRPHNTHIIHHTHIKVKAVIDRVSFHPRRHLGSFLYSPSFSVPDQPSMRRSKVNFSVAPNLLPSFTQEDQLNCTYTVRVSRTWLNDSIREVIWKERFLWGSGIYTDDSDPMAAAFHSGFIKAAWPEGTDIELLESIIKEQNPKIDFVENVPPSPMIPPSNRDLHITLLVLPTLESYKSTTRFGIRSRDWPESGDDRGRHDGVSFAVLNCEWVDEGGSRGKERGGKARKERLLAKLGSQGEVTPRGYQFQERDWSTGLLNRLRVIENT